MPVPPSPRYRIDLPLKQTVAISLFNNIQEQRHHHILHNNLDSEEKDSGWCSLSQRFGISYLS